MYKLGKILIIILFVIFVLTVYWGFVSYLQLDTNPLNWNGFFRFTTVIFIGSVFTGLIAYIITIINE